MNDKAGIGQNINNTINKKAAKAKQTYLLIRILYLLVAFFFTTKVLLIPLIPAVQSPRHWALLQTWQPVD